MNFNDALAVVKRYAAGIGYVADAEGGMEDDASFVISYGPKAWVIDGDFGAMPLDLPFAVVDKTTGDLELKSYAEIHPRLAGMRDAN